MTRPRHQILGKDLHVPLAESLGVLAQDEKDYEVETKPGLLPGGQNGTRGNAIANALFYAVLEHLGYGPIDRLKTRIERGVDEAVDYFWGDWWRANDNDIRALDRSRPFRNRQLQWFWPLRDALLVGGLTGRWDDIARIASWFDATMRYCAGSVEDEYVLLFLCIASDLRPQPIDQIERLRTKVRKCRARRPRLLSAAWDAAIARDQKVFDRAFKESVAHFLETEAEDVPNVTHWVARDQSIVWLVAERNGLQFPELPEKLDAAVVRRQTIGLA